MKKVRRFSIGKQRCFMQAFGGANEDPYSWDVFDDQIAYGTGPCLLVQNINEYSTECYLPLPYGVVTCVRFTADGRLIVGTSHGVVLLITPLMKEVNHFIKFESSITHCEVDKKDVVISTALHGIHALNIDGNQLTKTETPLPNIRCIALAITRFNEEIILGISHPDGRIEIFVPSTQSSLFVDGTAWNSRVVFCPESEHSFLLGSASQDRCIHIWRLQTTETSAVHKAEISVAGITTVQLTDTVLNVEVFKTLRGHNDWVNSVSFRGFQSMASASFDGQVIEWTFDDDDYDIITRYGTTAVADDQSGFIGCKIIGDNDIIAVSRNGGISRWVNGAPVRCFAGHSDEVTGLAWSPHGFFVSVGLDNTARVFAQKEGHFVELARPLIHGYGVYDVCIIDDHSFAFGGDEKCIRLLEPTRCFGQIYGPPYDSEQLPFAAMVPPLRLSNQVISDQTVDSEFPSLTPADFKFDRIPGADEMWLTRWPETKSLWGHEREIRQMCQTPNWYASGDDRGGVLVRDLNHAKRWFIPGPSKSLTTAMAGAPDSSILCVVCISGLIRLFDPATGSVIKTIQTDGQSWAVTWAPNSEYFAIGDDHGISMYERDGNFASSINLPSVTALEFIQDLDFLAGFKDGAIKRFSYDASKRSFTDVKTYLAHGAQIHDIRAHGDQFISGGADNVVLLQKI